MDGRFFDSIFLGRVNFFAEFWEEVSGNRRWRNLLPPGLWLSVYTRLCSFPQKGAKTAKQEITVENSYFSTFSTDFSTTVFHRRERAVYTFAIYIMRKWQPLTKFPLFRIWWFFPVGWIWLYFTPLTTAHRGHPVAGCGKRPVPKCWEENQKNCKKGLILFDRRAIMCTCMKLTGKECQKCPTLSLPRRTLSLPRSLTRRTRLTSLSWSCKRVSFTYRHK